jgi:hypothetical protein
MHLPTKNKVFWGYPQKTTPFSDYLLLYSASTSSRSLTALALWVILYYGHTQKNII